MYYQNYEDYMRQILGYSSSFSNIYEIYDYKNRASENTYYSNKLSTNLTENEMLDLYPDIYNKIYPIVCKLCDKNKEPITKEYVEQLTDEVYNLVKNDETVINIRVETSKFQDKENSNIPKFKNEIRTDNKISKRTSIKSENLSQFQETRKSNLLLRDLIKIIILQRLFQNIHKPSYLKQSRLPFQGELESTPFHKTKPLIDQKSDMKYFNY